MRKAGAPFEAPARRIKSGRLPAVVAAGELTRTFFTRARFVHGQRTAGDFLAVERRDRGIGGGGVTHGDEAEAAGAAGFAIVQDGDVSDGAVLREEIAQIIFSGLKREITYV